LAKYALEKAIYIFPEFRNLSILIVHFLLMTKTVPEIKKNCGDDLINGYWDMMMLKIAMNVNRSRR